MNMLNHIFWNSFLIIFSKLRHKGGRSQNFYEQVPTSLTQINIPRKGNDFETSFITLYSVI